MKGEKEGQIQESNKVSPGDALKAINGIEVSPLPERKGTLKRVVELMNRARKPKDVEENGVNKKNENKATQLINSKAVVNLTFAPKIAKSSESVTGAEIKDATERANSVVSQDVNNDDTNIKAVGKVDSTVSPKSALQRASSSIFRTGSDSKMPGTNMQDTCLECQESEKKIKEVKATAYALTQEYEKKMEMLQNRVQKLCEKIQEESEKAEKGAMELNLIANERDQLSLDIKKVRENAHTEAEELKAKIQKAEDHEQFWKEELEKEKNKRITSEESMGRLAQDGEAWVNALATKEEALRALESDLDAMKVRNETLQTLLDSSRNESHSTEREIEKLKREKAQMNEELTKANSEADILTSKLKQMMEEFDGKLSVLRRERDKLKADMEDLQPQLSVAQAHSNALREAMESAEERAQKQSKARQDAEAKTSQVERSNEELESKIEKLKMEKEEIVKSSLVSAAERNPESGPEYMSMKQELEQSKAKVKENESLVISLQGTNDSLRAQVKSLKSKIHSLAAEVGKVTKVDSLEVKNNQLMVKASLAEAAKMEAEDELDAYKRALMQFAEQAKQDEARGNGSPWSNRPKIFDHLYKKQSRKSLGRKPST
mmetsp:Transcript_17634/g.22459  ORF Transcript_17634/g.22459 Transcript_17634/m.22459 type:complete len:606 (-) Transcript_17634:790-2607(-)